MTKKTALILSGGGARGAFEVGAEKYAREEKGYSWDVISGVSVGALNGFMLAMEKYERLWDLWNTISNDRVVTGGFNLRSVIKLAFGAKSFYGNGPLWKTVQAELDPSQIKKHLQVGTVSLITGEYIEFDHADENLAKAILASTVIPIIWAPVDVSDKYRAIVDGGLICTNPIGNVLDHDPDEVVIINCDPEEEHALDHRPANILEIGLRAMDINMHAFFRKDIENFRRINHMVKEAGDHGVTLHSAKSGRPIKYFEYKVIKPDLPLGDVLDFSQPSIQRSIKAGWEQAKAVLG